MIVSEYSPLNGKEFDMLPKKIYLNYVNENDVDKTWSEEPVSASDCEMDNREYTDLSQVWHDISKKPLPEREISVLLKSGSFISCYSYQRIDEIFKICEVLKWAYADDLLPKGSKF